jgi:hypothetical protein
MGECPDRKPEGRRRLWPGWKVIDEPKISPTTFASVVRTRLAVETWQHQSGGAARGSVERPTSRATPGPPCTGDHHERLATVQSNTF